MIPVVRLFVGETRTVPGPTWSLVVPVVAISAARDEPGADAARTMVPAR